MKSETERHMLPQALGMTTAAALTVMVAAAAPAQADRMLSIGLQSPGGPIVIYPGPEGLSR
jgi:hypothetical protein